MSSHMYVVNVGLGPWQTPLAKAAREKGFKIIGVDRNPAAPGVAAVDMYLQLSAHDPTPILEAIQAHGIEPDQIQAVITIGSRGSLTCAAQLAAQYNGAGPVVDLSGLDILVDRERFRRFLEEHGLSVPRYRVVTGPDDGVDIEAPLIVKCALDTSGSEGLTVVTDRDFLPRAILHAQSVVPRQRTPRVIVEQYIVGQDIGTFGFFVNGRPSFQTFVDRVVRPIPHCLPDYYVAPATLTGEERDMLTRDFGKIAHAIGVRSGPFYTEFRLSSDGSECFALEAEPTLPAFASQIIATAYGVDLDRMFVDTVINGDTSRQIADATCYAACRFVYSDTPGHIEQIAIPGERDEDAVAVLRNPGDPVDNQSAGSICAVVFSTGENEAAVDRRTRELATHVHVTAASSRTQAAAGQ